MACSMQRLDPNQRCPVTFVPQKNPLHCGPTSGCGDAAHLEVAWWEFDNNRCMIRPQGSQERVDEEGLVIH
jgi:hypothetical protein